MRIENEDQNVTLKTLEQLCKVFRVDVAELFPSASAGSRSYQAAERTSPSMAMVHDAARPRTKDRAKLERAKPGREKSERSKSE